MDDSSSDIETCLPDLSGFRLDEVAATGNHTLRRVVHRLTTGVSLAREPLAGFSSSAALLDEAGTPGSRILSTTRQTAEESAESQCPLSGFNSSLTTAL